MKILILIGVAVLTFGLMLVGNWKIKNFVFIALAIGGAVNANFFNASAYPINCFGLAFGIDSVIYTLFVFCVLAMFHFFDNASAIKVLKSAVSAILFSAVIQFVAEISSFGYSTASLITFLKFLTSVIGSILAILAMLEVAKFCEKKNLNKYVSVALSLIVASVINSTIYYGAMAIFGSATPQTFLYLWLPSFIGKTISLVFALVAFYFLSKQKTIAEQKPEQNAR